MADDVSFHLKLIYHSQISYNMELLNAKIWWATYNKDYYR